MKPYYERDGITIYHGDARKLIVEVDPSSIGLVLTDPPYGKNLSHHSKGGRHRPGSVPRPYDIAGDDDQSTGSEILQWCVIKHLPTIVFASPMKPWPGTWRQHLVWDKGPAVGGGGDISTCWKMTWELIQIARTGKLNGSRHESVLKFWQTPKDSESHPAAKPVDLLEYLMAKVTDPDELICDPFMGIGSTLRAAKNLSRRAIGIEINEPYCEIAARRLEQGVLQFEANQ